MSGQPDMNLLNSIFGIESQEDWDDDLSNTHKQRQEQPDVKAEERAAEFEQMIAAADVAAVENDTTRMGWKARLHRGQFYGNAEKLFGKEAAELAYEAFNCSVRFARADGSMWQALKQLRATNEELFNILIGVIAYRGGGIIDRGPFGNDWGE